MTHQNYTHNKKFKFSNKNPRNAGHRCWSVITDLLQRLLVICQCSKGSVIECVYDRGITGDDIAVKMNKDEWMNLYNINNITEGVKNK